MLAFEPINKPALMMLKLNSERSFDSLRLFSYLAQKSGPEFSLPKQFRTDFCHTSVLKNTAEKMLASVNSPIGHLVMSNPAFHSN